MTTPRKACSSSAIATHELWFPWYDNIHRITQLSYSLGTPYIGFNQYSHIPSYSRCSLYPCPNMFATRTIFECDWNHVAIFPQITIRVCWGLGLSKGLGGLSKFLLTAYWPPKSSSKSLFTIAAVTFRGVKKSPDDETWEYEDAGFHGSLRSIQIDKMYTTWNRDYI